MVLRFFTDIRRSSFRGLMAATPERPGSALDETGPAAPESWEPPSHRPKSHHRRNLTLVIVAIVVVVILALTGNIPGIPGIFPSRPTNGLSFDSARPIADSMAQKLFGSSQLYSAEGIANNRTHVGSLGGLSGNSSCLPSGGSTSRLVVPAEEGNLTLGLAAAWTFLYVLGPRVIFFVGVVNGSAVYYGELSNSPCWGVFQGPYLPSDVIDSRQAASIAAPEAADFAKTYGVSLVDYRVSQTAVWNGGADFGWALSYESCSLGVHEPGYSLFAAINGTSGAVTEFLTTPIDC